MVCFTPGGLETFAHHLLMCLSRLVPQLPLNLLTSAVALGLAGNRVQPSSPSPDVATHLSKEQGRLGDIHRLQDKRVSALFTPRTNSTAADTEECSGSVRRRFHSAGSMHSASQRHMAKADASETIYDCFVRSCCPCLLITCVRRCSLACVFS
jgi:hypothetical protein